MTEAERIFDSL